MLNTIRTYAGSLAVKILFLILVLSFVLWGIGDVFSPGRGDRQWIAKVGDGTITPEAFSQAFDRTARRVSEAIGRPIDRSQAQALGLVDTVLNQMISQALLDQAAADLGLAAGDGAVRAQITSDRRFRTAADAFDAEAFRRALLASGLTEPAYVQLLRSDIIRRQLVTSITALPGLPKPMLDLIAAYEGERRVADYVLVPEQATAAPPAADETTLAAYHREHAARFTAPEYRAVSAIVIRADTLATGIAIGDDALHAAYDERADEFTTPERRSFRQLVLPDQGAAQRAYERLTQGATLAAVTAEFAHAAGGEPAAIEVTRDDLPAALADALFALAPGKFAGPIETPLGWHVLVLDAITPAERIPFETARERLKIELARDRAADALAQAGDRLDDVLGRGATLEQAAAELGLSVVSIEALDAQGRDPAGRPLPDLLPDFAATAFATAEGGHSLLTEAGDQGYFVVRVDRITASALKPFETVRQDVAAAWRRDEITRLTKERAERLAQEARGGRPLAEAARTAGLERVRTKPLPRRAAGEANTLPADMPAEFVTALFAAKPAEVFVIAGANGQYVGALERIEAAPAGDPANTEALRRRLTTAMQGDILVQYLDALRRRHPVSVNTEALAKLF